MTNVNEEWERLLQDARSIQQEYYELLPECTVYTKDQGAYLKHNIGFAIFGNLSQVEMNDSALNNLNASNMNSDVTMAMHYKPEVQTIIDTVYDQICKCAKGGVQNTIYYGVIYNVILPTKQDFITSITSNQNDRSVKVHYLQPIFKVTKREVGASEIKLAEWFIDIRGRAYKSWDYYKRRNVLSACTMVLPMHGIYQLDPCRYHANEYSSVWLEILESPACNIQSTVLNTIDTAATVSGVVGIGLSIASVFTPAAPIVLGAGVISAATGVWTVGRSTQNLVDRSLHNESISLMNSEARSSWLSIAGGSLGVAFTGGRTILTKCAAKGMNIGNTAKYTYNLVMLGNIGVNGLGMGCQAYRIYTNYQENQRIDYIDVVSLTAHILFFGNAVVSMQFANDLIRTTQGRILDDYKSTLRSKNLRKKFARSTRKILNKCKDDKSGHAEVIRRIREKSDFIATEYSSSTPILKKNVYVETIGEIAVQFMDPRIFLEVLLFYRDMNRDDDDHMFSSPDSNINTEQAWRNLGDLLNNLLKEFYASCKRTEKPPTYSNIRVKILNDMKHFKNALKMLELVFKACATLMILSQTDPKFINDSICFVWNYVKECMRRSCRRLFFNNNKELHDCAESVILKFCEDLISKMPDFRLVFQSYVSTMSANISTA